MGMKLPFFLLAGNYKNKTSIFREQFYHYLHNPPSSTMPLEKAMASHSSTLAWKIPWMEEPGRLQSTGSLRVRHDWATSLSLFTFMHWRRKWQPTPVFLPGEIPGTGEPGGLPSMGSYRVGHDWSDLAAEAVQCLTYRRHSLTVELVLSPVPWLQISYTPLD